VDVLPDLLADDLRLVITATVVGGCAARRGHYYAGPGQSFYPLLAGAGLTPEVLDPRDDGLLPELGVGLTDVVTMPPHDQGLGFDVPTLAAKIDRYRPAWLAFNGKEAAKACARWAGQRPPGLGLQSWTFAGAPVYVLPSSSGANRRRNYDGRPDRASWWDELGALVRAR
jgi:TDG/mug DNA glycosylase family protein